MRQNGAVRLVSGSKGIALLLAIASLTLLASLRAIDGAQVVDFLKWVLPGFFAATAAEDFGKHLAERPRAPGPTATATVNGATVPPPRDDEGADR